MIYLEKSSGLGPKNGRPSHLARIAGLADTSDAMGELELYYQPKMHAGYRTPAGAEALIRCDILQGYTFDAPLMIDEFEKRYLV